MSSKTFLPLLVLLTFLFNACKKDEEQPQDVVYPNYSQLKVGNYWVYQRFEVDTSGNETPTNIYDSCFVQKDTFIRGETYFKVIRPGFPYGDSNYVYVRDSLHYTVNHLGKILFSSEDGATIFSEQYDIEGSSGDTIVRLTESMVIYEIVLSTPAGLFSAKNFVRTYYLYPGWNFPGEYPRKMNTYYAKDVGIVIETLPVYAGNPNHTERRLVRYHLN